MVILLFSAVAVPAAVPVQANVNTSLATSFSFALEGDVVSAGVGLRGRGAGTIQMNRIPAGAKVYRAYLYWATLGDANSYTTPIFNLRVVQGAVIGTTGDTCWNVQHNFVYRADVTSLVTGNGDYSIGGLPADLVSGNDTQGASLVVVYRQSGAPYRTILVTDGAVALDLARNAYTQTLLGYTVDSPVTNAHITYLVGDGQSTWDSGNLTFNGTSIGKNIFSGVDGPNWGTHTLDVTRLVNGVTSTTTINNNDPSKPGSPDCLLWAATIFSVTSPVIQEANQLSQSFRQVMFGDVTTAGVGLRGVGSGSIDLSGIPAGASVYRAYLYWATLGNAPFYTAPTLDGVPVQGAVIGVSADTCWGTLHNYVYRADVTNRVKGNQSYTISGLPNNLAAGNDSQGASLVVIYAKKGLYRTVIINDGAVTLNLDMHTYTDTIGPFTADQPLAEAHITYLIGDGQSNWDSGSVLFEGQSIATNVFNGVDGNYWGDQRFNVTGLVTEPDAMTTINNDNPSNPTSPDCLLWAATVFAVQTEAPTNIIYLPVLHKQ